MNKLNILKPQIQITETGIVTKNFDKITQNELSVKKDDKIEILDKSYINKDWIFVKNNSCTVVNPKSNEPENLGYIPITYVQLDNQKPIVHKPKTQFSGYNVFVTFHREWIPNVESIRSYFSTFGNILNNHSLTLHNDRSNRDTPIIQISFEKKTSKDALLQLGTEISFQAFEYYDHVPKQRFECKARVFPDLREYQRGINNSSIKHFMRFQQEGYYNNRGGGRYNNRRYNNNNNNGYHHGQNNNNNFHHTNRNNNNNYQQKNKNQKNNNYQPNGYQKNGQQNNGNHAQNNIKTNDYHNNKLNGFNTNNNNTIANNQMNNNNKPSTNNSFNNNNNINKQIVTTPTASDSSINSSYSNHTQNSYSNGHNNSSQYTTYTQSNINQNKQNGFYKHKNDGFRNGYSPSMKIQVHNGDSVPS